MRNRIAFFISLILLLGLGGCNPYKDVRVESFKLSSFDLKSTSKASIVFTAKVENPLDVPMSLLVIDGTLLKDYVPFASITLDDEVIVPANSKKEIAIKINASLTDPMSLLSMGLNISSWELSDFRTSAKVTLKLGSGRNRTYNFKNVPLEKMINTFK